MKGWKSCPLGDAPIEIIDGDRGKNYPSEGDLLDNGYCLFLSTKNVRDHGFDFSSCQFITNEKDNLLRKGKLRINDLVLTTRGTVGNIALYDNSIKYNHVRINSGMVIIRPIIEKIDPKYIFYTFKLLQREWPLVISGSAQPQLPIKDIKNVEISIPKIDEQHAIAAVLSSFDDRIDLLHRQNATLEAMAEALFQQWFVVEAKEEWEEKTIGDVVEIKGGSTPSTKKNDYWDGNISWTSPKDLTGEKYIFIFSTERTISADGLAQISSGLLPKGTLLLSSRAPIGYLAITDIELAINQGYIAILNNSYISSYYMYLWCKYNMEGIKAAGNGSVFQEISKSVFRQLPFLLPPKDILSNFNSIIESYFQKIHSNQTQINTLEKIRDTLLPKLMSGEVRVDF